MQGQLKMVWTPGEAKGRQHYKPKCGIVYLGLEMAIIYSVFQYHRLQ